MKCPACGHEFANPTAQAGGRVGGAAKVAKGFSNPAVQAKALATRRRKARAKRSPNAEAQGREAYPAAGCSQIHSGGEA